MDPMTLAALASAGQTGMKVVGALLGHSANKKAASFNRRNLREQMRLTKKQRAMTRKRSGQEMGTHMGNVNMLSGHQRASYAASGVTVDTGSAGEVSQQTYDYGQMDAATIRENTAMELDRLDAQYKQLHRAHRQSRKKSKWGTIKAVLGVSSSVAEGGAQFGASLYEYYGGSASQTMTSRAVSQMGGLGGMGIG